MVAVLRTLQSNPEWVKPSGDHQSPPFTPPCWTTDLSHLLLALKLCVHVCLSVCPFASNRTNHLGPGPHWPWLLPSTINSAWSCPSLPRSLHRSTSSPTACVCVCTHLHGLPWPAEHVHVSRSVLWRWHLAPRTGIIKASTLQLGHMRSRHHKSTTSDADGSPPSTCRARERPLCTWVLVCDFYRIGLIMIVQTMDCSRIEVVVTRSILNLYIYNSGRCVCVCLWVCGQT